MDPLGTQNVWFYLSKTIVFEILTFLDFDTLLAPSGLPPAPFWDHFDSNSGVRSLGFTTFKIYEFHGFRTPLFGIRDMRIS